MNIGPSKENASWNSVMQSVSEDEIAEIADALLAFSVGILIKAFENDRSGVSGRRRPEREFNAMVETMDGENYEISLFDGIIASIHGALKAVLNSDDECVNETFETLASTLLGDKSKADVVVRCALYNALIFVLLHEYAHIVCGHFRFEIAKQNPNSDRPTQHRFREVSDSSIRFELTSLMGTEVVNRFAALSELEADATAYQLLSDFAYEIFVANSEVAETIPAKLPPHEVPAPVLQATNELQFYSATLALSLIEFARKRQGDSGGYPLPFTRVMNIATVMIGKLAPGPWTSEGSRQRLSKQSTPWVQEFAVRTIYNAMELCEVSCRGLGLDLREIIDFARFDETVEKTLTLDLFAILQDKADDLATREAQELMRLQNCGEEFRTLLRPFRMKKWWD